MSVVIVVPCYNEADRLPAGAFKAWVGAGEATQFLFVNDGSTDTTAHLLDNLCDTSDSLDVCHLDRNVGKAEAVRAGLLKAIESDPEFVGFWDADLATPLEEIPRFLDIMKDPTRHIVMGARVNLLGREIKRNGLRHYMGRGFATAVSALLGLNVYDTQCGAKLFRVSDDLRALLAEPFCSRWIFDVELLARWLTLTELGKKGAGIYELPLLAWRDIGGTKIRPWDFFRAPFELLRIRTRYFGSG